MIVLTVFNITAFARMNTGQDGQMMGGGLGWGMNFGLFFLIVIAILAIFAVAYLMKRK
jgi:hypothetical protein